VSDEVEIAGRCVGPGHPCLVIAEAGVNHNGDLDLARQLVRSAAAAGADAVKFQTFVSERLVARTAPKAAYQRALTSEEESQLQMLQRLELDRSAHIELIRECGSAGIAFLSSAFDEGSIDLLNDLHVPAYKVPSGELVNHSYLRHLALKKRPVILSTGMADLGEVADAVDVLAGVPLVLLHCVSLYPAPPEVSNLRAMDTLRDRFRTAVGFSDHSTGIAVAIAAVARGADALEKHLTLDRSLPGPDHMASLEPYEFEEMVTQLRLIESALGDGRKAPAQAERAIADIARKSVVAAHDIPAGVRIEAVMLTLKRPGDGLPPGRLEWLIGRRSRIHIPADTTIRQEMIE
jgi:N,N'-diacetyllegionaminate synthase